jgi:hypothetical protein
MLKKWKKMKVSYLKIFRRLKNCLIKNKISNKNQIIQIIINLIFQMIIIKIKRVIKNILLNNLLLLQKKKETLKISWLIAKNLIELPI